MSIFETRIFAFAPRRAGAKRNRKERTFARACEFGCDASGLGSPVLLRFGKTSSPAANALQSCVILRLVASERKQNVFGLLFSAKLFSLQSDYGGLSMRLPYLTFLFLSFALRTVGAQQETGNLHGFVSDAQSRLRLAGVSVLLVGTGLGDASDLTGFYKIDGIPAGEYEVEFRLVGYRTRRQKVVIRRGKTTELDVVLVSEVLAGREVTVEAERAEELRARISKPTLQVASQEVKSLSGALQDVMRTLPTRAGVVATSDFSNQFVVRGGGPEQNLVLLNDVEIYNPYRGSGMPSPINPDLVETVNLYAGGYPASYGDRLSSVLTAYTRGGTTSKWLAGRLGLNLVNANFAFEGKLPRWNGSWLVGGRRTYKQLFTDAWARRLTPNEVALPDFEDWQAVVTLRPTIWHKVRVHTYYGRHDQNWLVRDEVGEQEGSKLDGRDHLENLAVGVTWDYLPSVNSAIHSYANWYRNRGRTAFSSALIPNNDRAALGAQFTPPPPPFGEQDTTRFDYAQDFDFKRISAGAWFVQELGNQVWEAGVGLNFLENTIRGQLSLDEFGETVFEALRAAPNWLGAVTDSAGREASYQRMHFYVQDKIALQEGRMFVQPGLRFDLYGLTNQALLSPRLRFGYQLDDRTELRAAAGIFRQSPGYEKLLDGGQIFNILRVRSLEDLSAEKATHFQLGGTRSFEERWKIDLDFYYKRFDGLVGQERRLVNQPTPVYVTGAPAQASSYEVETQVASFVVPSAANNLDGQAYGVDLVLEKVRRASGDRFYGRLAYSLSRSTRETRIQGQKFSYPYEFDRTHSLNLAFNYRIGPFTVGVSWQYGTGFPYTPAVNVQPLVGVVMPDSVTVLNVVFSDPATGFARFVPTFGSAENINSARLPAYHRLDARITYATEIWKSSWNFYLDFINVYNRKNVLFYRYRIEIEGDDENLPPSLRFPKPVLLRKPVLMYPFIPSFGIEISF